MNDDPGLCGNRSEEAVWLSVAVGRWSDRPDRGCLVGSIEDVWVLIHSPRLTVGRLAQFLVFLERNAIISHSVLSTSFSGRSLPKKRLRHWF